MGPRQQGDRGEASALEWLISRGYSVYQPFGHSPDVDLVVWDGERYAGVQVKTTRHQDRPGTWTCAVCTRGGNQSWNKITKRFSADRCDFLFVLVADGRRWFIPSSEVGGKTAITVTAPKYARFEIVRGVAFA